MESTSSPLSTRRNILLVLLGGVGTALAALAGWPLLRFFTPSGGGGADTRIEIPKDSLKPGGAHFFDFLGQPAVLLQPKPGEFVAMTAVCTHLGCIVKWVDAKQEFLCPCHGGRFSSTGKVLGGPPPSPLKTYPVAISGDLIIVGQES